MQPVGGVLATLVRPIGSLSISMIPITYNLSLGHLKYSSLLKYLSQSVCHNITDTFFKITSVYKHMQSDV